MLKVVGGASKSFNPYMTEAKIKTYTQPALVSENFKPSHPNQ